MNSQSWSIVVFCFNEVDTVADVILKAVETLQKMEVSSYEILVVDDGSTDGSQARIKLAAAKSSNVRFLFHESNKGIGEALRTGYFNAKNENLCAVPADGQFDVEELIPYASFAKDQFVSFYRKENTTYSVARNMLSYANKLVNKVLNRFAFKDVNWVKIYKRETLSNLSLELHSSLIESEICAKLTYTGIKCLEVESRYLPRTAGESKGASLKIVKQAIKDTFHLFYVLKRFRKELKRRA